MKPKTIIKLPSINAAIIMLIRPLYAIFTGVCPGWWNIFSPKRVSIWKEIVELINQENRLTVKEVVEKIKKKHPGINESIIAKEIFLMWKNGNIEIVNPIQHPSLISYIKSIDSLWFHTLLLIIITTIISFILDLTPIKIVLGTLFLLFIPGYVLLEYLYPISRFHSLEKIALSIGLSIVVVSLLGLIMNYTPAGILSVQTLLLIAIVDVVLGILALIKKYNIALSFKGGH